MGGGGKTGFSSPESREVGLLTVFASDQMGRVERGEPDGGSPIPIRIRYTKGEENDDAGNEEVALPHGLPMLCLSVDLGCKGKKKKECDPKKKRGKKSLTDHSHPAPLRPDLLTSSRMTSLRRMTSLFP